MSSPEIVENICREKPERLVAEGSQLECRKVDQDAASEHVDTWSAVWVTSVQAAEDEVSRLLEPYGMLTDVPEELRDVAAWHHAVAAESDHSLSKRKLAHRFYLEQSCLSSIRFNNVCRYV